MLIGNYYLPHILAVVWFVICWVGYTRYANAKGRTTPCLASVLHLYREDWMRRMLLRDNRISWCMRQYNFAAVLVGSAPTLGERNVTEQERKAFAERTARVISMAANQFNQGLRAYYFGMATLAWFINPWFFMLVSTGVVLVLYRREFHSDVLEVMVYTQTPTLEPSKERTD